jgi:hypothetical protein
LSLARGPATFHPLATVGACVRTVVKLPLPADNQSSSAALTTR